MHTTNIHAVRTCKWAGRPFIISERANYAVNQLPKTQALLRDLSYPLTAQLVVQTQGNYYYCAKLLVPSKITVIPNSVAKVLKSERSDSEKAFGRRV